MYPSSEEHTLPVPPLGFERGAPTSEQSVDPQREKLEQLLGTGMWVEWPAGTR